MENIKMERKIKWESYQLSKGELRRTERDDLLDDLEGGDDEDELVAEEIRNAPSLVESPYGLVSISDDLNPFSQAEFMMAHCNFSITAKEFVLTNFAEGVESVKVMSRYRMLVGFGKMFEGNPDNHYKEVKDELANRLIDIHEFSDKEYKRLRRILASHNSDEQFG